MILVICDGYGQFRWFTHLTDKTGEFRYVSRVDELYGRSRDTLVVIYGPLRTGEAAKLAVKARERFPNVERIYDYEPTHRNHPAAKPDP